jgi:transposase
MDHYAVMPRIPPFRATPHGVTARLHKPHPWRPMTDDEWDDVQFIFAWLHPDRGRPLACPRTALDACFHAACSDKPWRELPAVFGKWQTIHRLFVRWTHKRAWEQLLKFVASRHNKVSPAIVWWVCKAFRRARRIMGIKGYMLARRLGMDSALPAPSWFLPDPVVWDYSMEVWFPRMVEMLHQKGRWREKGCLIGVVRMLWGLATGRRFSWWMAPEMMFPGLEIVPGTGVAT